MHLKHLLMIIKSYLQYPTDITFIKGSPLLACANENSKMNLTQGQKKVSLWAVTTNFVSIDSRM